MYKEQNFVVCIDTLNYKLSYNALIQNKILQKIKKLIEFILQLKDAIKDKIELETKQQNRT